MSNFYYTDANGRRQGTFTPQQLKALVAQGIITPDTPLETDSGHKGKAGQIKGLFNAPPAPNSFSAPITKQALPQSVSAPIVHGNESSLLITIIGIAVLLLVGGIGCWIVFASERERATQKAEKERIVNLEREREEREYVAIATEQREQEEQDSQRLAAEQREQEEQDSQRLAAEQREREEQDSQRLAAEQRKLEQEIDAAANQLAGERIVLKIKDVEYAFRWCPAGTFRMGSSPDEAKTKRYDETQHQVTLSHGFWMLETEVTQKMWESVMKTNPSKFKSIKLPVEQVSWNDCQEYIKKLNDLGVAPKGYRFSLPTEAQWEYACRAGTTTAYHFGDTLTKEQANFSESVGVGRTSDVGSYPANAWGLYDMHGNVWEWCLDRYGDYPSGAVTDPVGSSANKAAISTRSGTRSPYSVPLQRDRNIMQPTYRAPVPKTLPKPPLPEPYRVLRGGGWGNIAEYCRSAIRLDDDPSCRFNGFGFRLSLVWNE